MIKIYIRKEKIGVDAFGVYNPETKECIVKKGSKVSETLSKAPTFKGINTVVSRRRETVKNNIVIKDVAFKSSSTAGNYVTGRSTDGFKAWKVEDGRTLREFLSSEI